MAVAFSRKPLNVAVERALFNPRPSFVIDGTKGEYLDSRITLVRNTNGWRFNSSGNLAVVAANLPRWDHDPVTREPRGMLIETARTNVVLHNRDLTITRQLTVTGGAGTFQDGEAVTCTGGGTGFYVLGESTSTLFAIRTGAGTFSGLLTGATSLATKTISSSANVWIATNCTVAQNRTGLDGVANSASRLTATGANATVLQAITLSSSERFPSAYVTRITGSGVVEMTTDNGATWTALAVTATRTKLTIPSQTLANPTVGFRIVTSGDAIEVDVAQNEATGSGSPIVTTTAAVTRNKEVYSIPSAALPFNPAEGTFVIEYTNVSTNGSRLVNASNGTETEYVRLTHTDGSCIIGSASASGATGQSIADTIAIGGPVRQAGRYQANDLLAAANGVTPSAPDTSVAMPTGVSIMNIGSNSAGNSGANFWLKRLAYYPKALPDFLMRAVAR